MKGYFVCAGCGKVVGTRGRGPIRCSDGHKGVWMDWAGEGEEGKKVATTTGLGIHVKLQLGESIYQQGENV